MDDPPSLLFLWTDQQAYRPMGPYGNDRIETPALDALAESGTVFENAYCASPLCTPSRSAIMTGQYPFETGCIANNVPLAREIPALPELATDGYATCHVGKWHLGDELFPQHGFDEWVATEDGYNEYFREGRDRSARSDYHHYLIEQGYEPDVEGEYGPRFSRGFAASLPEEHSKPAFMARRAIEFIERHRDEPFVLSVNFLEPHTPYTGPRDDQYDPGEVDLPPNFEHDGFEDQAAYIRNQRAGVLSGEMAPSSLDWETPPTERDWREYVSNYWGLVSLVDTHAGRILDAVDDAGRREDTVVAYTSDHGDQLGSHKLWAKDYMLEESAHIPLLVRLPGIEGGRRIEEPFSQVDLAPTLLEAMDQPVPEEPSGKSWYPALAGAADVPSEPILLEFNFNSTDGSRAEFEGASPEKIREGIQSYVRAVVTPDRWKYVFRQGVEDHWLDSAGEDSLYDLGSDPYETRNLIDDPAHADRLEELRAELRRLRERFGDPTLVEG